MKIVVIAGPGGVIQKTIRSRDPESFVAPVGSVDVSDDPCAQECVGPEGQRKHRLTHSGSLERKPRARLRLSRDTIRSDGEDFAELTLEGEGTEPVKVRLSDGSELLMAPGQSVRLRAKQAGTIGGRIEDESVYADSKPAVGVARDVQAPPPRR